MTIIKVLHIISGEYFAGAERVQDLLAIRLPCNGVVADFACLKPDKFPKERVSTSKIHIARMRNRFDIGVAWKIARIVQDCGYQVLHTHSPRAIMIGGLVANFTKCPLVHHVHSPTSRDTESVVRNRLNSFVENHSLSKAKVLIPVSASLADYLRERAIPDSRIRIIPNGVPAPSPFERREFPKGAWTIGCIALFRPRKGLEVLIQALAILKDSGFQCRLRAVGTFETRNYELAIKRRVSQLGLDADIEWIGYTRDVNAELTRMDAFVLPSLYGEGMPMVILEAMAMAVPVIASAIEGIPEMVEHNRSGLLVPPGNSQALAESLVNVLSSPEKWASFSAHAYQTHASHFSDVSMANGVARVYREILGL